MGGGVRSDQAKTEMRGRVRTHLALKLQLSCSYMVHLALHEHTFFPYLCLLRVHAPRVLIWLPSVHISTSFFTIWSQSKFLPVFCGKLQ